MDYEKAYKEALETARKINNGDGVAAPADWTVCETIFPVLREDYDERMVNRIIDLIKEIGEDDSYHVYHYDDMLAWLEKQKSIDVLDKEEREFADNVDAFRKEIDAAYQRGYEEGKRQNKCKFSVGDIVKHSLYDGLYYIVKSIDLAGDYELECLNGKSGNNIAAATEEYLSLWTIQDAKDGDVLVVNNNVFIYAHRKQMYPIAVAHCFVDEVDVFHFDGEFGYTEKGNSIHPATKEQRDTFFAKMKEAGYEWDAEKKELKKIESTTNITENFEKYVEHLLSLSDGEGHGSPAKVKEVSAELLRLANQQKPAWSEEDDKKAERIIRLLQEGYDENCIKSSIDWLINRSKSLKPQNKWVSVDKEVYVKEPVLVQKKDKSDPFKGYVVCCDHTLVPNVYERYIELDNNCYQTTWKPSDEQMHYLSWIANIKLGDSVVEQEVSKHLNELLEDLKKLRKE